MDLNSILMSALIGAISIGGALGLAEIFKKIAPERSHQIITYVAIGVGVAVMTLVSNEYRDHRKESQIDTALSELAADVEVFESNILGHVKDDFPDEYQAFLGALANAKTEREGEQIGIELTSGIRRKYAGALYAASPGQIADLFKRERELHEQVSDALGWQDCNKLIRQGAGAFLEMPGPIATAVEDKSILLFETLGALKSSAPIREAATSQDWDTFVKVWSDEGHDTRMFDFVLKPDYASEKTCAAFVIYFEVLGGLDGDVGDRLRTQLLVLMTKG